MELQNKFFTGLLSLISLFFISQFAFAERITHINEPNFLNALTLFGYTAFHEGFEDDTAWSTARYSNTAPSISNLGITWFPNDVSNGITTGSGPARTGNWGFFSLPHNPNGDGFIGTSNFTLYAVGGWFETNTPPAKLGLFLDNEPCSVDFGEICDIINGEPENCVDLLLSTQPAFYGVIDTNGFTTFEFRELEGVPGDQKLLFSDDFTFGVAPPTCPNTPVGDLFLDCKVDVNDLELFIVNWQIEPNDCPPNFPVGDFNFDCWVDFNDFAMMAPQWFQCFLEPNEACLW
ncbi:MAG: hypothetical protein ACYSSP_09020 [Planctomycetota bacterium]|jgi:hypothetical protein